MHISVDIETLDSAPTAKILQISAVAFELKGAVQDPHELMQEPDRWFDVVVNDSYGTVSAENKAWWDAPEQAGAKARIDRAPKVSLPIALQRFSRFVTINLGKRGRIWAKPPSFDLDILRGAYARVGEAEVPWHFRQELCLRTLLWLGGRVPEPYVRLPDCEGTGLVRHYALHDAAVQAVQAQAVFRALAVVADQRRNVAAAKLSA